MGSKAAWKTQTMSSSYLDVEGMMEYLKALFPKREDYFVEEYDLYYSITTEIGLTKVKTSGPASIFTEFYSSVIQLQLYEIQKGFVKPTTAARRDIINTFASASATNESGTAFSPTHQLPPNVQPETSGQDKASGAVHLAVENEAERSTANDPGASGIGQGKVQRETGRTLNDDGTSPIIDRGTQQQPVQANTNNKAGEEEMSNGGLASRWKINIFR
ncbi:hypothetical protein NPX13_g1803 [Xylaria arbuscula]|uniref:Uncharacterized protein n=1 Tax=Xylaria arbuscula TaxID=114810 RepID=A0A9W8TRK7_9PEZI|nr:hypothetical protein NPX13_g1803 [Xylaria arbuscula]